MEYKTSLSQLTWTPLPAVDGNGEVLELSDPNPPEAQRFYRVRAE